MLLFSLGAAFAALAIVTAHLSGWVTIVVGREYRSMLTGALAAMESTERLVTSIAERDRSPHPAATVPAEAPTVEVPAIPLVDPVVPEGVDSLPAAEPHIEPEPTFEPPDDEPHAATPACLGLIELDGRHLARFELPGPRLTFEDWLLSPLGDLHAVDVPGRLATALDAESPREAIQVLLAELGMPDRPETAPPAMTRIVDDLGSLDADEVALPDSVALADREHDGTLAPGAFAVGFAVADADHWLPLAVCRRAALATMDEATLSALVWRPLTIHEGRATWEGYHVLPGSTAGA